MKLLLDTQVWLWMLATPEHLAPDARDVVEEPANVLLLSAVSSWEIAIKHALGKLVLPAPPETFVPDRIRASAVTPLAIEHSHALRVNVLPAHHRDPFDRMLIAQAQVERVPILTADVMLRQYDVETISAT